MDTTSLRQKFSLHDFGDKMKLCLAGRQKLKMSWYLKNSICDIRMEAEHGTP